MECSRGVLMRSSEVASSVAVRGWSRQVTVVTLMMLATVVVGQPNDVGVASQQVRRQPGDLHYAIDEELHVGTRVADIVADADLYRHGVEALRLMTFRLLNQPTGGLVVGKTTGILSVGSRLDREQLCADADDLCQIRLDVAVQPMTYFQIIKVTATIVRVGTRLGFGLRSLSVSASN